MRETELLRLIDRLYGAALDEDDWPEALDAVALAFDGVGATIINLSSRTPEVLCTPGIAHLAAPYMEEWWQYDSLANYGRFNRIPLGVFAETDFLSREFMSRDMLAQDLLRPHGIGERFGVVFAPFGTELTSFTVQRRYGKPLEDKDREAFALVAHHVSRAVSVRYRLSLTEAAHVTLANHVGGFDCAVAVVDPGSRILLANEAFGRLAEVGLRVAQGRLRLPSGQQATFERMVGEAIDGALAARTPDTLAVPVADRPRPLLLRIAPVSAERMERSFGSIRARAALVVIVDPNSERDADPVPALVLLGLTKGQARVAALVGTGVSAKEAALRLGLSDETVRTVIKNVYAVLGISKQTELARLVAGLAATLGH